MITTKRLKGVRATGGLSMDSDVSAEVVYVYDDRTRKGGYQMRLDGRTSAMMSQSTAESMYYHIVDAWLEMGAAHMLEGMPLGVLDDSCYDGASETETTAR